MHTAELFAKSRAECQRICIAAARANQVIPQEVTQDGECIARVLCDFDLHVDRRDLSVAIHLFEGGFWEWWISKVIADILRPGMVCVDIGANAGYFTALMIGLEASRVFAFEPIPQLARLLRESKVTNGWDHLEVHEIALSDEEGMATLGIPSGDNLGGTSILATVGETMIPDVPMNTLDAVLEDVPKIDLIKMDAEGAEPLIWEGMQETARRNPQICILAEITVNHMAEPWLEKIEAAGFAISFIECDGTVKPMTKSMLPERVMWMLYLTKR